MIPDADSQLKRVSVYFQVLRNTVQYSRRSIDET